MGAPTFARFSTGWARKGANLVSGAGSGAGFPQGGVEISPLALRRSGPGAIPCPSACVRSCASVSRGLGPPSILIMMIISLIIVMIIVIIIMMIMIIVLITILGRWKCYRFRPSCPCPRTWRTATSGRGSAKRLPGMECLYSKEVPPIVRDFFLY